MYVCIWTCMCLCMVLGGSGWCWVVMGGGVGSPVYLATRTMQTTCEVQVCFTSGHTLVALTRRSYHQSIVLRSDTADAASVTSGTSSSRRIRNSSSSTLALSIETRSDLAFSSSSNGSCELLERQGLSKPAATSFSFAQDVIQNQQPMHWQLFSL